PASGERGEKQARQLLAVRAAAGAAALLAQDDHQRVVHAARAGAASATGAGAAGGARPAGATAGRAARAATAGAGRARPGRAAGPRVACRAAGALLAEVQAQEVVRHHAEVAAAH